MSKWLILLYFYRHHSLIQTVFSLSYSPKGREEQSTANGSYKSNTKIWLHAQERTLHLFLVVSSALHNQGKMIFMQQDF